MNSLGISQVTSDIFMTSCQKWETWQLRCHSLPVETSYIGCYTWMTSQCNRWAISNVDGCFIEPHVFWINRNSQTKTCWHILTCLSCLGFIISTVCGHQIKSSNSKWKYIYIPASYVRDFYRIVIITLHYTHQPIQHKQTQTKKNIVYISFNQSKRINMRLNQPIR